MSIWSRIGEALAALSKGAPLADVFDRLRAPPERSIAFTIAVIALGAKMAKADGLVTRNEVAAFREVFTIPAEEEANAARVFNLARQDVTGYDGYARRIAGMFGAGDQALRDLMEGLFHIAMADGTYHPQEEGFLRDVAGIFGLSAADFDSLEARHLEGRADPYRVLGVAPDTPREEVRRAWAALVRDSHPDQLIARGLPQEAVKLAERRLVAINAAWEEIQRRPGGN